MLDHTRLALVQGTGGWDWPQERSISPYFEPCSPKKLIRYSGREDSTAGRSSWGPTVLVEQRPNGGIANLTDPSGPSLHALPESFGCYREFARKLPKEALVVEVG